MGGETLEVRREKLEVRSKVCHQRTLESKNHESEVKSWKSEVRGKREGGHAADWNSSETEAHLGADSSRLCGKVRAESCL